MPILIRVNRSRTVGTAIIRRSFYLILPLICLPFFGTLAAQVADQRSETFRVTTSGVLVDVVVRDQSGRLVTDLTLDDFTVLENGQRQTITSFRYVGPQPAGDNVQAAGSAANNVQLADSLAFDAPSEEEAVEPPAVVALVFDAVSQSPEGRALAYTAARSYVQQADDPAPYVGVFVVGLSFATLQHYTADRHKLLAALDHARRRPQAAIGPSIPPPEDPSRSTRGPTSIDQKFKELDYRLILALERLERDHAGYAATNGLLALIHSMRALPGRKTLALFSEGLILRPASEHHLDSVIDAANRANVAIYTLDAAGLRVRSPLEDTRERIRGGYRMEPDWLRDAMLRNPEIGLTRLAVETGGVAVRDTNDLRPGLRQIVEESQSHYLLGYTSTNHEPDGKFRRIDVRISRPGYDVRARRGYTAVREDPEMPVLVYEAPALALLDGHIAQNAFPIQTAVVSLPEPKRPGLTPVVVGLHLSSLVFDEDRVLGRYRAEFVVLVRLRDSAGRPVRRFSQRYVLGGPLDEMSQAKQGELIFYRQPDLEPGAYTLEAVVYDSLAEHASVRVRPVEVLEPVEDMPHLGLFLVRHAERVSPEDQDRTNPLYFGEVLLYPHFGEPFRKGIDRHLMFFAAIHPGNGPDSLEATVAVQREGETVVTRPLEISSPARSGRMEYAGQLPLETFSAGEYELRIGVRSGARETVRAALFSVVD